MITEERMNRLYRIFNETPPEILEAALSLLNDQLLHPVAPEADVPTYLSVEPDAASA